MIKRPDYNFLCFSLWPVSQACKFKAFHAKLNKLKNLKKLKPVKLTDNE